MKKWLDHVFVGVFVASLMLIIVDAIVPFSSRTLIVEYKTKWAFAWPQTLEEWKVFPKRINGLVRDTFGLRQYLIASRALISGLVMRSFPDDRVRWGHDGWLFLNSSSVRNCQRGLAEEVYRRYSATIEKRQRYLANLGIKYVMFIVPSKEAIYPENKIRRFPDFENRRVIDGVVARLVANGLAISANQELMRAKEKEDLFFRRDLHWNPIGAAVALEKICSSLGQGGQPQEIASAERVVSWRNWPSDLARLAGLLWYFGKEDLVELRRYSSVKVDVSDYNREGFFRRRTCSGASGKERVLMFHDSFGSFFVPGLAECFGDVVAFETATQRFEVSIVKKENPTIVLEVVLDAKLLNRGEVDQNDGI
jgi:hypothetical protein